MVNCFREKYAKYYDLIYKDKDYEKECDYLEKIFRKFLEKRPKTILDLACGTGGHAIPLVKRGYEVTGIDASKSMVDIACRKAKNNNLRIDLCVSKMQDFKFEKRFDIIISMFSTIDYLVNNLDLKRALVNIKQHLKKNGLFIFDFWNGFAVMEHYEPKKIKIIKERDIKVKRVSLTELDLFKQQAKVKFNCLIFKKDKLIEKIQEIHDVRFFFPWETMSMLEDNGFKVFTIYPFLSFRKKINIDDWDLTVVTKRIS